MTREEKCKLAIEKGYTYNPETGKIYGVQGKEIKRNNGKGYIKLCININKKNNIYLFGHQFAWYWIYKQNVEFIDHINGIKYDNRINNLRYVTKQQNSFNTNAKGYCWSKKSKKWVSYICINYKQIYLGLYNTEEEARQAYLNAKEKYHII
jgi:hypothetical protein